MEVANLLMRISKGNTEFQPESESEMDYMAFQPIAHALLDATDEGLLEIQEYSYEDHSCGRFYNKVAVKCLTDRGNEYLESIALGI